MNSRPCDTKNWSEWWKYMSGRKTRVFSAPLNIPLIFVNNPFREIGIYIISDSVILKFISKHFPWEHQCVSTSLISQGDKTLFRNWEYTIKLSNIVSFTLHHNNIILSNYHLPHILSAYKKRKKRIFIISHGIIVRLRG